MKRCSICKQEKPLDTFTRNRAQKDGYAYQCKECRRATRDRTAENEAAARYRETNREILNRKAKEYAAANPDKIKAKRKKHYAENRESVLEKAKRNHRIFRERRTIYRAQYHNANRERRNAQKRAWHETHRDEQNELTRQWRLLHPECHKQYRHTRRARALNSGGAFTAQEWQALKTQYNHTCLCCKQQEPSIKLTPDHVIPLVAGGRNDIANIQPLCLQCNRRKGRKTTDYRLVGVL